MTVISNQILVIWDHAEQFSTIITVNYHSYIIFPFIVSFPIVHCKPPILPSMYNQSSSPDKLSTAVVRPRKVFSKMITGPILTMNLSIWF